MVRPREVVMVRPATENLVWSRRNTAAPSSTLLPTLPMPGSRGSGLVVRAHYGQYYDSGMMCRSGICQRKRYTNDGRPKLVIVVAALRSKRTSCRCQEGKPIRQSRPTSANVSNHTKRSLPTKQKPPTCHAKKAPKLNSSPDQGSVYAGPRLLLDTPRPLYSSP